VHQITLSNKSGSDSAAIAKGRQEKHMIPDARKQVLFQ